MGVNFSDWHFSKVVEWRKAVLDSRHDGLPMGDGIVLVWLDNDSRLVVNKARDIYKRLTNIVHTTIVKGTKEPKHFIHNHELEEYIWNQI